MVKLLIAIATGVRRVKSSTGNTGSLATRSSTNRNTTSKTALAANRPTMSGSDQLYSALPSSLVLLVRRETASNPAPRNPAINSDPSQSMRVSFSHAVSRRAGVEAPLEEGLDTVYVTFR